MKIANAVIMVALICVAAGRARAEGYPVHPAIIEQGRQVIMGILQKKGAAACPQDPTVQKGEIFCVDSTSYGGIIGHVSWRIKAKDFEGTPFKVSHVIQGCTTIRCSYSTVLKDRTTGEIMNPRELNMSALQANDSFKARTAAAKALPVFN